MVEHVCYFPDNYVWFVGERPEHGDELSRLIVIWDLRDSYMTRTPFLRPYPAMSPVSRFCCGLICQCYTPLAAT